MDKILTISVAAYNVEGYLNENLGSIIGSKYKDEIEVIVVDDGGTDHSLEIARKFEHLYPGIVKAIHKENGGYGTTVNYSIDNANGKYFKILDGDDWVNTEGLDRLIEFLKANKVDCVLTQIAKVQEGKKIKSREQFQWDKYNNDVVDVNQLPLDAPTSMWYVTCLTEIAKKNVKRLPEKCLYTDILYVAYILPEIKKVGILSEIVYVYRLGRDEQSVSKESRKKHIEDYFKVVDTKIDYYYEKKVAEMSEFTQWKFLMSYKYKVFNYLLFPASRDNLIKIKELEKETKEKHPKFYEAATWDSRTMRLLRRSGYLAYWPIVWFRNNNW